MRIEPTDKSSPVRPASQAPSGATPAARTNAGSDHVELSALSYAAGGLSPQRIEEIQGQVSSGTYQADAAAVSHSIVDFYLIPLK